MANELDELNAVDMPEGRDAKVIAKQIPVKVGGGSKFFDIIWWFLPVPIIGGIICNIKKVKAKNYIQNLQQKLQHDASQIDNYLEQRVQVLQNTAALLDKAVNLDKETFTKLAAYRAGNKASDDEKRMEFAAEVEKLNKSVNIAFENYPELKSHQAIADAMQKNMYLQREITAAREVYNDTVNVWNRDVFSWPTKQIVAAKEGYTTRIPYIADDETREAARKVFF